MDVVLLCLAILAVAAYVAGPLYRTDPKPDRGVRGPGQRSGADARSTSAHWLEDLEVDRASGLVDEATYARERAALEAAEPDPSRTND